MDAYVNYILRSSEAKLADLRREAAERTMSRAARAGRRSWRDRVHRRRRIPELAPVTTVWAQRAAAAEETRRSA